MSAALTDDDLQRALEAFARPRRSWPQPIGERTPLSTRLRGLRNTHVQTLISSAPLRSWPLRWRTRKLQQTAEDVDPAMQ